MCSEKNSFCGLEARDVDVDLKTYQKFNLARKAFFALLCVFVTRKKDGRGGAKWFLKTGLTGKALENE